MRRLRPRGPDLGFTLIEVLVALTIVAVALAAGIRAAGSVTNNAQRLADVTAAQWCADNALALVRLRRTKDFPGVGDRESECQQRGRSYRVLLRVRSMPFNPNFRMVRAFVGDEAGQPILSLVMMMGRY